MIFHVASKEHSALSLYRIAPTEFMIIEFGTITPIISCPECLLVHKSILPAFCDLKNNQVIIKPVSISRKATRENWKEHLELKIQNQVSTDNIEQLDTEKEKIWHYKNNLFVNEELKIVLEQVSNKLTYSVGFSQFGGSS